ncbi:MAG: UvrD-helicase domain-containing protein [bacterium]
MKSDNTSTLNKEQKEAIKYNNGPLLIVAGAGTGKTFVIVEKIKHLIKTKLAKPENILVLTFTEKAAAEMEERVDKILPFGYFPFWISTFHSFADKMLKEEAIHIGLNPSYKLQTQAESIMFIKNNIFKFNLKYFRPEGNPQKFTESLYQHFSRLKDEYISPDEYLLWAKKKQSENIEKEEKQKILELVESYNQYQKLMIKNDFMDFSDLIFYLLELFKKRKNILHKYRNIFKYILVDEFQDTNIAQYQIIKYLSPASLSPKLTVVGDDSQAIYKFRGASVSNILTFMKDFPKAKLISLRKNYRSNQEILDGAYKLIQNNNPDTLESKLGISKNLISQNKKTASEEKINFFWTNDVDTEANNIADEILKLKEKKYSYSDIAILVRANNHADAFVKTLSQKGIPYQFLGPGMLYKQPEIKDLIAYLNILVDIEDSVSLFRVLGMDIFAISNRDLSFILSFAKKTRLPLFNILEIVLSKHHKDIEVKTDINYDKLIPQISNSSKDKIFKIYNLIKNHLALINKDTAGQILYNFLEDSGYLIRIANYGTTKEEKIALNISKFFKRLKAFETDHEETTIFDSVDFIKMSMDLGESPSAQDIEAPTYEAVNILTIHAAKGLEFPIVFMVNLTKDRFPTRERKELIPIPSELIKEILPEGDYHLQEERRLFYVGLTRAKNLIYLTSSKWYGEAKRQRRLSVFVIDTLSVEYINKMEIKIKDEKEQMSIFDYKKKETIFKKKKTNLSYLSYSRINTYLTCPLRYKYSYVLNVPVSKNAALVFGETIHSTLQKFYREFNRNKKINFANLISFYKKEWIPQGYSSKSHHDKMYEDGIKMLKAFYKKFHSKNIEIIDLEKPFRVKTDQNVILSGKIDRVDKLEGSKIEIIDYKTGKLPDEKKLKGDMQLAIYFLAATDKNMYNRKPENVLLTFYFLRDMEKISFTKTASDIVEIKNSIANTIEKINESNYSPKVGPWCSFCPYKMMCEAWQ